MFFLNSIKNDFVLVTNLNVDYFQNSHYISVKSFSVCTFISTRQDFDPVPRKCYIEVLIHFILIGFTKTTKLFSLIIIIISSDFASIALYERNCKRWIKITTIVPCSYSFVYKTHINL